MNKAILVAPIILLMAFMPHVFALGLLHFKPHKDATVLANQFLAVNGTSAPSNATHTHCDVKLQTNGHGYMPVKPQTPSDYTKWNGTTSEMIKAGVNSLEAKLECFPPGGPDGPNLIHHLVHNVTGV